MKTVTVRDLQKNVKGCVDEAQEDRVIITRRGRPAAVLIGVEGKDWEAVVQQTDPAFWRLIRRRRRQPTLSVDEIRAKIGTPRR
jgi:prevent-host-death family protein